MPTMSLVTVTNGPVAMAGSIFSFSSTSGTSEPNTEANRMTPNSDNVTAMVVTWALTASSSAGKNQL